MKVAFDENMPAAMLRVFGLFQRERSLKHLANGITIHKAQEFYPRQDDPDYSRKDDAPWIRRFARADGRVIISGNTRMQVVPHERLALVQEGMTTIFFPSAWSGWKFFRKCALIMHWWPIILKVTKKPRPGFFVVPNAWPESEARAVLRKLPNSDLKLEKIEKQLAVGDEIRKERRKRRDASEQMDMFEDRK